MPDHLVSAPSNDSSSRPVFECRVFDRHACELPGRCQPTASQGQSAEPLWTATVVDISRGGIRLRLRRRFERGSILTIELKGANATQCCTAVGKVVHVRANGNGFWIMGCQFFGPLGDDELKELLSSMNAELPAATDPPAVISRRAAATRIVKLPPRRRS